MSNKALDYAKEGLDEELPINNSYLAKLLKKGKVRVMIIYEDNSYTEHFVSMKEEYTVTIGNKKYIKVPKTVLRGKNPFIVYYYNNPMPIVFEYERTKLTESILKYVSQGKHEKLEGKDNIATVSIDAKALNTAFTSNLVNKMYQEPNKITAKSVIIILVVLGVTTLIILHVFGVIDLYQLISGTPSR